MIQKLNEIQNSQLKWQKNPQENPGKETWKMAEIRTWF